MIHFFQYQCFIFNDLIPIVTEFLLIYNLSFYYKNEIYYFYGCIFYSIYGVF